MLDWYYYHTSFSQVIIKYWWWHNYRNKDLTYNAAMHWKLSFLLKQHILYLFSILNYTDMQPYICTRHIHTGHTLVCVVLQYVLYVWRPALLTGGYEVGETSHTRKWFPQETPENKLHILNRYFDSMQTDAASLGVKLKKYVFNKCMKKITTLCWEIISPQMQFHSCCSSVILLKLLVIL